ncbi:MAG: hypothetical protein WC346_11925 [Methanogenium sp.]|jgi:hypothetical protein
MKYLLSVINTYMLKVQIIERINNAQTEEDKKTIIEINNTVLSVLDMLEKSKKESKGIKKLACVIAQKMLKSTVNEIKIFLEEIQKNSLTN